MSEQKFEKQVRQAMEEFALSPTAPVWHKIATEIRRKKERRRILFWLLPLGLLSSAIIWWSLATNERSLNITTQKNEPQNTHNKPIENSIKVIITEKENKTATVLSDKEKKRKEKATNSITTNTFKKTNSSFYTITRRAKIKQDKNAFITNAFTAKQKEEKLFSVGEPSLKKERLQDNIAKIENAVIDNKDDKTKNLVIIQKTDTIQEVKKSQQKQIDTAKAAEQIDEQKPRNKNNKKLIVGAIVHFGYSGITSGLFDGFGQKSLRDFAPSSPLQSGAGGGVNLLPSNIKKGLAFSLGFNVKKKTGDRSSISSGFQYQYNSTQINIGTRVDSVSNFSGNTSFFRNDNQSNSYTNQYHFITLPVSYDYQLFKKLPLHLGAGLSLSQLISSNALHYDGTANIYYKDNSLLNKTQAALFTNLTYKIGKETKSSIDIGPQLNYNLTPLQKKGSSKRQHLFSIGLNTQVNF